VALKPKPKMHLFTSFIFFPLNGTDTYDIQTTPPLYQLFRNVYAQTIEKTIKIENKLKLLKDMKKIEEAHIKYGKNTRVRSRKGDTVWRAFCSVR